MTSRQRSIAFALVLFVASAAFVAGCGAGGDTAPTNAGKPNERQLEKEQRRKA